MNNLSGSLSFHGDVSGQMGANLIPSVEANPSGTATEILTSIRVGDIIYSIPSGGGGGGGTNDYNSLLNKPKINNVILSGELSLADLGIPTSYNNMSNLPSINGVTLTGNKTSSELGIGSGSDDLTDLTWTLLGSTTGTSTPIPIPDNTKYLLLTAELGGYVSYVAIQSIANINKLATETNLTFNQGYEYCDIAGNHTTIVMSVSEGNVTISSGYGTVTVKVYSLS